MNPVITQLYQDLQSLVLYQGVLADEVGQYFLLLLKELQASEHARNEAQILQAYSLWLRSLIDRQLTWRGYLSQRLLQDDNPFTQQVQTQALEQLAPALLTLVNRDLQILQNLARCSCDQVLQWVMERVPLETRPIWENGVLDSLLQVRDWREILPDLVQQYRKTGTGLFGQYWAFRWQGDRLVGIPHPDPIHLEDLIGYETQQQTLVDNTQALMAGYPALHVLLYGSRGSGKSSLVKGLLTKFGDRGLRLVEVSKAEMPHLPTITEQLRSLPQKFILFIDDLSFEEDDDTYKALKVVLEGNITARAQNLVVYATSNRRHLIREFYGDRPRPKDADEIHQWDTLQEKMSFSDRFGITLTFEPADQPTYLNMVQHLAKQAQVNLPRADLEFQALQWATRHNGRSGRTARQFVDFLIADLALKDNRDVRSSLDSV
ncbi:MAG: ATP-binding protein [Synechococcales bacterium]|nr:ATP-binding protein [Synechococcales bacterium]